MKKITALLLLLLSQAPAHAYTITELRMDCQAAEHLLSGEHNSDLNETLRGSRCIAYIAGFADGYAIGDYLADKIGVQLGAFCLPKEDDLSRRLVRAVQAQLEYLPKNPGGSTATIVAGALARSFPCPNSLESKK